ncbi:MAG: sulfatase family protein [Dermatophilaceae bacterium]
MTPTSACPPSIAQRPRRHPRGRTAVAAVLTVLLAALLGPVISGGSAQAQPEAGTAVDAAPNVVMIVMDDLDQVNTPYWDAMPQTKQLLADRGTVFENAFAPTPICCPARSTMFTGKYGHNTGVLTNSGDFGGWEQFVANGNEENTFATDLQAAGYRTGLAGKYLNGIEDDPTHVPPGWNEWYGSVDTNFFDGYGYSLNENGTIVQYGDAESDYVTDVMAAKSTDFIRRAAEGDTPFLWSVNPSAPHYPLPPAPRHAGHRFADDEAPRPANYDEQDVSDKPQWLQDEAAQRSRLLGRVGDTDHQDRMGSLLAVDEMVAGIVDTLESTGELDNTYLMFVSDNGYNMGAHRLWQKQAPYEESLRVPLVVAGPEAQAGTSTDMVLLTDIAPTVLELAGLEVPADMDGRSLVPQLRGESPAGWRTDFIGQYVSSGTTSSDGVAEELPSGVNTDLPGWRGLRSETHTYVEWQDGSGDLELYDLRADPYQLDNLLATDEGRAANADLAASMAQRLGQLSTCSGSSCR